LTAANDPTYYLTVLDDFPVMNQNSAFSLSSNISFEEVLFRGQRGRFCVCFVDMADSTVVTTGLSDVQMGKYYSIFLNSLATIATNFGSRIIKNAGDCLICYFPDTSDPSNLLSLQNTLDCFMTMTDARKFMNSLLKSEGLPPVNYRISADYGEVEIAQSVTSRNDDLFGSTMNLCAKINSKATLNGLAIGSNLFKVLNMHQSLMQDYRFENTGSYAIGGKENYSVYTAFSLKTRSTINPLKRTGAIRPPNNKD